MSEALTLRDTDVLVTGHTGFKGGWLALYLASLSARVHGYSMGRTAGPTFYRAANVRERLVSDTAGDVLDLVGLREAVLRTEPRIVFHLAARAIVGEAVEHPVGTIRANVLGSVNVMEAVRLLDPMPRVILVTTDKVYRNAGRAMAEDSRLGGLDPYGASKAAVELLADSYRASYQVPVRTARAANVVGGGDWGERRLVPNCIRAFERGEPVEIHDASRVFLHVLDIVRGYLHYALADEAPDALNFGPTGPDHVVDVARTVAREWGGSQHLVRETGRKPEWPEAPGLSIDSRLAKTRLSWEPVWGLDEAIRRTVAWHKAMLRGDDMDLVSMEQLHEHMRAVGDARAAA